MSIPVSVKLGPWLSSPSHHAMQLIGAGARGLVLFNRFYEPDIDLSTLKPKPSLELSTPYEIRQALLWIAMLAGRVKASLVATSGVATADEVVKYLLAGADVVMTASSLLRHGPHYVAVLREGLEQWMDSRGFDDIGQLRGRLAAALSGRGFHVHHNPFEPDCKAVLVIGGTRHLEMLWQARRPGICLCGFFT